jgi:DNA ligase (NAD+)
MNKEYFTPPLNCPVCNCETKRDGVYLICPNPECSGGKIGDLIKWIKKLDLKGVAEATLEKLYNAELVATPADLYKLKPELIENLEGFGSSSANKIVETLNEKKDISFGEFIGGLNIPNVSQKTAELLERNGYDTINKLLESKSIDLSNIKGIGETTANDIINGISKKKDVILQLLNVGIKIKEKVKMTKSHPLTGKKVVFTGALNIKRNEAQKMVMEVGGECPSSLSKDTDFLVMADPNSGSSKAVKAQSYGTKVLSEDQFMELFE